MTPPVSTGSTTVSSRPRFGQLALILTALLILVLPNAVLFVTTKHRPFWLGQTITSALVVLSPLLLGLRARTALWVMSPFAAFLPFATAFAVTTNYPPSVFALQVLREATREEFITFLPMILIATGVSFGLVFLYWRVARTSVAGQWRAPWLLRVGGAGLLLLTLGKDIAANGLREGSHILLSRMEKMHPLAPLVIEAHLLLGGGVIPDRTSVLHNYSVSQHPPLPGREICVLILGESARKNAFGLYNPKLDTTPRLRARDLVVFTDATSCGTATIQSVPLLLTGRFPDRDEILPFRQLSLVEAFRLAGFHTAWLSVQQADGETSSFVTAFSINAQEKRFLNGRVESLKFERSGHQEDDALLPPFFQTATANPGKLFVVLHTLGSHAQYLQRYPPEFEKWPIDPKTKDAIWHWLPPYDKHQRREIGHAYLNTVLHTDWFVDQVISYLEKIGGVSSMIYISDHGENEADAKVMPAGHAVATVDVVNVPFFMWFSNGFRAQRNELVTALAANATKRVSAQDLFSTVCALHQLQTPVAAADRSLASPAYREHERVIMMLDGTIIPAPQ